MHTWMERVTYIRRGFPGATGCLVVMYNWVEVPWTIETAPMEISVLVRVFGIRTRGTVSLLF